MFCYGISHSIKLLKWAKEFGVATAIFGQGLDYILRLGNGEADLSQGDVPRI